MMVMVVMMMMMMMMMTCTVPHRYYTIITCKKMHSLCLIKCVLCLPILSVFVLTVVVVAIYNY